MGPGRLKFELFSIERLYRHRRLHRQEEREKPLYLKKEKIIQTFEIVVDQMPTRAGIDPYNKLIDRIPDDNMLDIVKQ